MAVIYLTHPKHGAKVAAAEWEALADEENGWTRYDPTVQAAPAVVETTPVADENLLRVRRKRRFDIQEGA